MLLNLFLLLSCETCTTLTYHYLLSLTTIHDHYCHWPLLITTFYHWPLPTTITTLTITHNYHLLVTIIHHHYDHWSLFITNFHHWPLPQHHKHCWPPFTIICYLSLLTTTYHYLLLIIVDRHQSPFTITDHCALQCCWLSSIT